jgi:hypothetical protein
VVGQASEAYDFEGLLGAGGGNASGGGEHPEVAAGGAPRVTGDVTEKRADMPGRMGVAVQGTALEEGDAAAGFEFEHEA